MEYTYGIYPAKPKRSQKLYSPNAGSKQNGTDMNRQPFYADRALKSDGMHGDYFDLRGPYTSNMNMGPSISKSVERTRNGMNEMSERSELNFPNDTESSATTDNTPTWVKLLSSSDTLNRQYINRSSFRLPTRLNLKEPVYPVQSEDDTIVSSKEASPNRRTRTRIILLIVVTFILIAGVCTVPIILTQVSNEDHYIYYESQIELTLNESYTEALGNKESEEFKNFSKSFCLTIQDVFVSENNSYKDSYQACVVDKVSEGSIIVHFRIIFNAVTNVVQQLVEDTLNEGLVNGNQTAYIIVSLQVQVTFVSGTSDPLLQINIVVYSVSNSPVTTASLPDSSSQSFPLSTDTSSNSTTDTYGNATESTSNFTTNISINLTTTTDEMSASANMSTSTGSKGAMTSDITEPISSTEEVPTITTTEMISTTRQISTEPISTTAMTEMTQELSTTSAIVTSTLITKDTMSTSAELTDTTRESVLSTSQIPTETDSTSTTILTEEISTSTIDTQTSTEIPTQTTTESIFSTTTSTNEMPTTKTTIETTISTYSNMTTSAIAETVPVTTSSTTASTEEPTTVTTDDPASQTTTEATSTTLLVSSSTTSMPTNSELPNLTNMLSTFTTAAASTNSDTETMTTLTDLQTSTTTDYVQTTTADITSSNTTTSTSIDAVVTFNTAAASTNSVTETMTTLTDLQTSKTTESIQTTTADIPSSNTTTATSIDTVVTLSKTLSMTTEEIHTSTTTDLISTTRENSMSTESMSMTSLSTPTSTELMSANSDTTSTTMADTTASFPTTTLTELPTSTQTDIFSTSETSMSNSVSSTSTTTEPSTTDLEVTSFTSTDYISTTQGIETTSGLSNSTTDQFTATTLDAISTPSSTTATAATSATTSDPLTISTDVLTSSTTEESVSSTIESASAPSTTETIQETTISLDTDISLNLYSLRAPIGEAGGFICTVSNSRLNESVIKIKKQSHGTVSTVNSTGVYIASDQISKLIVRVSETDNNIEVTVNITDIRCGDEAIYNCRLEKGTDILETPDFNFSVYANPGTPDLVLNADFIEDLARAGERYYHTCKGNVGYPRNSSYLGILIKKPNNGESFTYSEAATEASDKNTSNSKFQWIVKISENEKIYIGSDSRSGDCNSTQEIKFLLWLNSSWDGGTIECYIQNWDNQLNISTISDINLIPGNYCRTAGNTKTYHPDGCNKWVVCQNEYPYGHSCSDPSKCYNINNDNDFCETCNSAFCAPEPTTPAITTTTEFNAEYITCSDTESFINDTLATIRCNVTSDTFSYIYIVRVPQDSTSEEWVANVSYAGDIVKNNSVGVLTFDTSSNPKRLEIEVRNVTCYDRGQYVFRTIGAANFSLQRANFHVKALPGAVSLKVNADFVEENPRVGDRYNHICKGDIGYPTAMGYVGLRLTKPGNSEQFIYSEEATPAESKVTSSNPAIDWTVQISSTEIMYVVSDETSGSCTLTQEIKFLLHLSNSWDGGTMECFIHDRTNNKDISVAANITLIPNTYCTGVENNQVKSHPGGCNKWVVCYNQQPYGWDCSNADLCYNKDKNYCQDCSLVTCL